MPDEPKFLKGAPVEPAAKPLPEATREVLEPIIDAILETRVAASSRAPAPQASWTVPLADAVDDAIELDGYWLRFKVPRAWRERSRGARSRAWTAADAHPVALDIVPSPGAPRMEELLLKRAETRPPDGYHHVEVKPVTHDTCFDAAEIIEVHATAPKPRPLRFLQVLRHPRVAVWMQLDAPGGTLVPGVAADFAAMFAALTFTFR